MPNPKHSSTLRGLITEKVHGQKGGLFLTPLYNYLATPEVLLRSPEVLPDFGGPASTSRDPRSTSGFLTPLTGALEILNLNTEIYFFYKPAPNGKVYGKIAFGGLSAQ